MGDLIDRGPKQIKALELVRGMVEAGEASCVMGNHGFNAVQHQMGYRELNPSDPHHSFLKEFPKKSPSYAKWLDWFRTLPLWLEFINYKVIHACWDTKYMSALRNMGLGVNAVLNERLLRLAGE